MAKPFVVAIAGGTCSGKSTITERLQKIFENKTRLFVLNMDRFYKKPEDIPTVIAPITRKEYVEHNHPTSLRMDEILNTFNEVSSSDEYDLVLVEGLFALYTDEIRERADLKMFIDLASDERIVRRVRRFSQWGQTFDEITDRYIDTVRFRHNELIEPTRWHADLIVNGTLDSNKGTEIAADYISHKIGVTL